MKLLITGGAGFIGSAVIRHIIRHTDDRVVNVDKLTYAGNLASLDVVSADPRYSFERVDIGNPHEIGRIFQDHQPDVVMHLAAESHVDRSIDGPAEFIQTNIVGTYTLLEAARQYWQALPADRQAAFRFHHISTDEVYGDLGGTDELFTETTPYAPSSPYSASKASADHLVRAWYRTYGLPVIITNCSNNYGPYQYPEKLIPLVVMNALAGKPLPIYGKGDQIRDWLYVEDHARALHTVITAGRVGETYNIGGHNEKRNIDVVRQICAILDRRCPRDNSTDLPSGAASAATPGCDTSVSRQGSSYADLITFVEDRPGHDRRYAIDAGKIRRELGWVPVETFESGLEKTVQWYLDNPQWVAGLKQRAI